jgi:hypothetical protein
LIPKFDGSDFASAFSAIQNPKVHPTSFPNL